MSDGLLFLWSIFSSTFIFVTGELKAFILDKLTHNVSIDFFLYQNQDFRVTCIRGSVYLRSCNNSFEVGHNFIYLLASLVHFKWSQVVQLNLYSMQSLNQYDVIKTASIINCLK